MKANELGVPCFDVSVSCGPFCYGGSPKFEPATCPEYTEADEVWVKGSDVAILAARLVEAERLLRLAIPSLQKDGRPHVVTMVHAALGNITTDSASAVQPERCCLDYPRCDCNSPPEPDDDWLCFQRPAQPKVTP